MRIASADDLLAHLKDVVAQTRWPYFYKADLINMGATDSMFWELKKRNLIRPRDGIRGRIIELIWKKE
jgi:hypothetical protein